jgi:hypothetical protein
VHLLFGLSRTLAVAKIVERHHVSYDERYVWD